MVSASVGHFRLRVWLGLSRLCRIHLDRRLPKPVFCIAGVTHPVFLGWDFAAVVLTADYDILIFITLTGSICIFTSIIGLAGVILDSRRLLAAYAILIWPGFMSLITVGYLAYKRATFALDDKLDEAWSEGFTSQGRLAIQESLRCCGYFDALHESIFNKRCFPRTVLPGCKGELYRFEKKSLGDMWIAAFTLVPLQILNIVTALVCANHVTKTFGEGVTPAYCRLTAADVKKEADQLLQCSDSDDGQL